MQLLLSCRAHVWLLRNPMDAHHFMSMGFPKQEDWFSSVQSLSCIQLFATPWTEAREDSLSIINSWSLLRLISIELVMLSNHLILCHPLFLPFQSFSALGSFPELVLHIRGPKYWSFSFSISPSNEYSGLISFRVDWVDLLVVQTTLKSLHHHHSSKAINSLVLSFLYSPTLTFIAWLL